MVAERSPDQPKSLNSASKAVSNSSDSESEDVDVQSESEDELPPPRNAVRVAIDDTLNEYHMVLNKKQTKRRQKADKADELAKQKEIVVAEKAVETSVGKKQAVEKRQ